MDGPADYRRIDLTFNEYMTWAAYLVYAKETYDPETYEKVEADVVHRYHKIGGTCIIVYDHRALLAWDLHR